MEPYTAAALAEVDRWADAVGPAEITSVYVGGGTPTLALDSVSRVLERVRERFRSDRRCLHRDQSGRRDERPVVAGCSDAGVALVSLGVQSFQREHLATDRAPLRARPVAERALALLAEADSPRSTPTSCSRCPARRPRRDRRPGSRRRARRRPAHHLSAVHVPVHDGGRVPAPQGVRMPDLCRAPATVPGDQQLVRRERLRARLGLGFQARRRRRATRRSRATATSASGPGAGSHLPDGSRSTRSTSRPGAALRRAARRSRCACRSRARWPAGGGSTGVSTTRASR